MAKKYDVIITGQYQVLDDNGNLVKLKVKSESYLGLEGDLGHLTDLCKEAFKTKYPTHENIVEMTAIEYDD